VKQKKTIVSNHNGDANYWRAILTIVNLLYFQKRQSRDRRRQSRHFSVQSDCAFSRDESEVTRLKNRTCVKKSF